MSISELITPYHLERQALIYIRQSSPHQVLTNQESRRLQYALRQRALDCGWAPEAIEVIDADQSRTARTTQGREGFKELITRVTLDRVGIIFSYDVTRLSRNCTDWYQVLDLCGYRRCLIGDRDGIYDPATINGRLLLGLKGQLSELELHTIKARLTAGLLNKAQRGELALTLPVGLARDPLGRVVKRPDREVQDRINLVFATFLRVRSLAKVVRSFNDQGLLVPRRDAFGDVVWRRPTVSSVGAVLKNPAYAGSFVYGRTRTMRAGPDQRAAQKLLPACEWRIHIRDVYPPYIDWATYEKIQAMIRDNHSEYDRNKTRGVPRRGRPCCTASCTAASAATRWSFSTRAERNTCATRSASRPRSPSVSGSPVTRSTTTSCASSSRRWRPRSWTSTTESWPRSPRNGSRFTGHDDSNSNGSVTRPAWPSASTRRPTPTTASWPPNWRGAGRRRYGN